MLNVCEPLRLTTETNSNFKLEKPQTVYVLLTSCPVVAELVHHQCCVGQKN